MSAICERGGRVSTWDLLSVSISELRVGPFGLVLTEGGKVETAPGAVERAMYARVGIREVEVAEESVAPDGVVGEEAVEPAAGEGEAQQVEAAQVLGHLRPQVRLVPASRNTVLRIQNSGSNSVTKLDRLVMLV